MSKSQWKSMGYLARKKDTGCVTIMITVKGVKTYYICNLSEALDVLTGRRSTTKILQKIRR